MSQTETIYVENIRCGGCVKSITGALEKIPGVTAIEVFRDEEKLQVTGEGLNRAAITDKLDTLGYPEKGNNSLLRRAKSLISCATGKLG